MNAPAATVFVVDDDSEVRAALARLLRSAGWRVVPTASASEFLDQVPATGTGCILLDVNMPGMSGPELHQQLREREVTLPVIYLTGQGSVPVSVRAMKYGALDFLEKPVDDEVLLDAIEQAVARHWQANALAERQDEIRRRLNTLSPREREVMNHVIDGRLNKQIASDLGIAEKTVKVHRGRVMTKIGVRSVAELVHLCDELGIVRQRTLPTPRARDD